MSDPAKLNLTIYQGATFQHTFRWETDPIVYVDITAITKDAPARVTAPSHGLVDGWRVAITNVKGMKQINAANTPPKAVDFVKATVVDANTVELNDVNSTDYSTYTSGGVLRYYTPVSLAGYTARMKLKKKQADVASVLELTTVNSRIIIDTALNTIKLFISATDTAALTDVSGVYDLELVSAGGVVTRLVEGNWTLSKEVTN